jgi:hypothetical protein
MAEQAWSGPQGHMVPMAEASSGPKVVVYDTTGHLLGRAIHVGDVFLQNVVGETPVTPTGGPYDGVAYDATFTKMSQMTGDGGNLFVVMPAPPEVGAAAGGVASFLAANYAKAFVVLAAATSKIKPYHGMEIADIATVSVLEPQQGGGVRLGSINGPPVRATPGRKIVLAKVKLAAGATTLAAGAPLVVWGASQGSLAVALDTMAGARVVGRVAASLTGVTDGAVVLALVDFDGDHGFGMVANNAA